MPYPRRPPRPILLILSAILLITVVAIPVLAAGPRGASSSASPAPSSQPSTESSASAAPAASVVAPASTAAPDRARPSKAPKPERVAKPANGIEADVTLKGTMGTRTPADGDTEYTLNVGSATYTLDAGPSWFWKDKHPLKPFVGKSVTVVGEQAAGSTEIEVRSVDGTVIREPGRPQWAGGWKRVGKDHPGWSQEKWDKWQARLSAKMTRFGVDCWPPGHCKSSTEAPTSTSEPSGGN